MNGRVSEDSLGRLTYHGKNRESTVDYIAIDQDLFSNKHLSEKLVYMPRAGIEPTSLCNLSTTLSGTTTLAT